MSRFQNNDASSKPMFRGLCVHCKYTFVCNFPRNPELPIFHCDEFEEDDHITDKRSRINKTGSVTLQKSAAESPSTTKKYIGLCSNCELRDTCVFPKPEGGVWHCEEYE